MKHLIITIALFTSCVAHGAAPEMEIQGTLKQDEAHSRFRTEKAVVTKVFSAESDGALFRAYAVTWNGNEIVISDMPALRKKIYKEGDTITFMVQRTELKREGATPILSFMLMPEFEMPQTDKKDGA